MDFGWLSAWFRLDFGFWLSLTRILIGFGLIWLAFGWIWFDFGLIWLGFGLLSAWIFDFRLLLL